MKWSQNMKNEDITKQKNLKPPLVGSGLKEALIETV